MYDMDKDGEVTIIDLLHSQAQTTNDCQFGNEVHSLVKEYSKILLAKKAGGKIDISGHLFNIFMPLSCVAPELSLKLFNK